MHHLRFIEATGESYDRVKQAIRAHLMRDHRLEPERLGFGYQEFLHMAACIRLFTREDCRQESKRDKRTPQIAVRPL